jgi:Uma2 family endonuclease
MSTSVPLYEPDISHLITEDEEPVDNIFSEKQQRLLTEPLYSSWPGPGQNRKFLACSNVGIFYIARNPAIVPDMLLSLDIEAHPDWWAKEHRSYFLWEFGKSPEVVIEIVSNNVGEERTGKFDKYARVHALYYAIFDPEQILSEELLGIYRLNGFRYEPFEIGNFPEVGLGLTLWEGEFEGMTNRWIRWVDAAGNLIPTGRERALLEHAEKEKERAEKEKERAEKEKERAEKEKERAEKEKERAEKEKERLEKEAALARVERLADALRKLGTDPDKI